MKGIPPHVLLIAEMESLRCEMASLKVDLLREINASMDSRGFRSREHNTNKILGAMDNHFDKMMTMTKLSQTALADAEKVHMNASKMIVVENEDECGDDDHVFFDAVEDEVIENSELTLIRQKKRNDNVVTQLKKREFKIGYHHNKLNPLPSNFVFPKMTPPQLITNWFLGNVEGNIPPYWSLNQNNVSFLKGGCSALRSMKSFMKIVEEYGRKNDCWKQSKSDWDYRSVNHLWSSVDASIKSDYMLTRRKVGARQYTRRKREKQWKSYYNDFIKAKAFAKKSDNNIN